MVSNSNSSGTKSMKNFKDGKLSFLVFSDQFVWAAADKKAKYIDKFLVVVWIEPSDWLLMSFLDGYAIEASTEDHESNLLENVS